MLSLGFGFCRRASSALAGVLSIVGLSAAPSRASTFTTIATFAGTESDPKYLARARLIENAARTRMK
jgi:hypothetical protein